MTVSDGYLRISNVTRNDTGSYSCVVKNDLKTERYSVYLTVQGGIRTTRAISIRMRSRGLRQLVDDNDLNYWIKHPFEFSDPILKPEYL